MNTTQRKSESGNVLFLILIAVALFAALSYAVTQSTRSGGGSTENEKNALSSASLAQYPAALRTSVVRMILNGTPVSALEFNSPSDFSLSSDNGTLVFHPSGGGGVYQTATDVAPQDGNWYFNGNFEIPELGIDGNSGNDIIAFLPGVSSSLCIKINDELGVPAGTSTVTGIPDFNATDADILDNAETGSLIDPDSATGVGHNPIDNASDDFNGQPTGCFRDSDMALGTGSAPTYIFYSVLLER